MHDDITDQYIDFLSSLRTHVLKQLDTVYQLNGKPIPIDFLFSIPTTWTDPRVVRDFELCVQDAGFIDKPKKHTAKVTLTEAQAAGLYAALRPVIKDSGDLQDYRMTVRIVPF